VDGKNDIILGMGLSFAALGVAERAMEYLDRYLDKKGTGPGAWHHLLKSLESVSPREKGWELKARYIDRGLRAFPEDPAIFEVARALRGRAGKRFPASPGIGSVQNIDVASDKIKEAEMNLEDGDVPAALSILGECYAKDPRDWRCNLLLMKISFDLEREAGGMRYLEDAFRSLVNPESRETAGPPTHTAMLSRLDNVLKERREAFYAALVRSVLSVFPAEVCKSCSISH